MDTSIIDYSDYITGNYTLPDVGAGKSLDSDDFYTLLLAEISNQDPTDPIDSKDMILQLSQFSAIENTQQLNDNMDAYITKASMSTAAALIGRDVAYLDSSDGSYGSGTVTGVSKNSEGYVLQVNGEAVPMDQVVTITAATTAADAAATDEATAE
ncbi:MAG: flagellar hook capping FlgD N-terminal domain-containing protein [Victivallales bacterium]|nr:flagellar hook capping FlgD N-terminal domain-containing protein [Victivallales bacterium]